MGSVTQLMVKYLTDQSAAYLEFYEFLDNGVLMSAPDYVPDEIVDGETTVFQCTFGSFGVGLLNVSKLKTGLITLARLTHSGNKYTMHIATGKGSTPGKWGEVGWANAPKPPSLDVVLDCPVDDFAQKVLGQHYIISYGDNTRALKDLCKILGVEVM